MIVRDVGGSWQVVLQTDHAELSGAFAHAWADRAPRHDSLALATRRHDDGWAVWERSPLADGDGKPVNFLDVQIRAHLAFYRACIASVSDQDAYAGLLVSMHGAGIYRQRYGTDPALVLSFAEQERDLVDAFVAEQEGAYAARMADAGVDDERRLADYRLLQVYDRLSLHFCMRDVERDGAELDGYRIEPAGPWRIRIDPYPFAQDPAGFSLVRRVFSKQARMPGAFAEEFRALAPEQLDIVVEAG